MVLLDYSIGFPNLGIELSDLPKSISVFGFEIAFYGLIIGFGIIMAMFLGFREAKLTGQSVDDYIDLALVGIIVSICGARLYYVIFQWDNYKDNLLNIFNIREGGLAIYGGIIAAIITVFVMTRIKKKSFFQWCDTGCIAVLLGQIIGRWGNFFNREAFGGDSNGLLAMKINIEDPTIGGYVYVPDGVTVHTEEAFNFIQVQPTFLYESFANLCLLILIMLFRKKKVFHGEVFLWYMGGYGAIRAVVEGFRTDQLQIGDTGIAVSQVLGATLAVVCLGAWIYMRIKKKGAPSCWRTEVAEVAVQETESQLTGSNEEPEQAE